MTVALCGCSSAISSSRQPKPAIFSHLWKGDSKGRLLPLELKPKNIYGMGLTYAGHLKETGSSFDPNTPPPAFKKELSSLNLSQNSVKIPSGDEIIMASERIEPGLGAELADKVKGIKPLLDYEGELAFVFLDDIDWSRIEDTAYIPRIGYFLANDISARALAILGEGRANRYQYWGASKSFDNFLPVGSVMWIPD